MSSQKSPRSHRSPRSRRSPDKDKDKDKNKNKDEDAVATAAAGLRAKSLSRRATRRWRSLVATSRNRARWLRGICSDSGVCIAFGKETAKIREHLGNFVDPRFMRGVTPVGEPSSNGFVFRLAYERLGYNASAILKCTREKQSDNLMFEYMAGQFANRMLKFFPCFVETYALLRFNDEEDWIDLMTKANTKRRVDPRDLFTTKLRVLPQVLAKGDHSGSKTELFSDVCSNANLYAVLTENLVEAKPLKGFLNKREFLQQELHLVLFQIYMPLSRLAKNFTHFDLHSSNVMLYEPSPGKLIQFEYFVPDPANATKTIKVRFYSRFVAKIIDYGRCFFEHTNAMESDIHKNNWRLKSSRILGATCYYEACKPDCGRKFGFYFGNEEGKDNASRYYISWKQHNMSHDLQLVKSVLAAFQTDKQLLRTTNAGTADVLYRVKASPPDSNKEDFGCPEVNEEKAAEKRAQDKDPGLGKIYNVRDMFSALLTLLLTNVDLQSKNATYPRNKELLGTLTVYWDMGRQVVFTEHVLGQNDKSYSRRVPTPTL